LEYTSKVLRMDPIQRDKLITAIIVIAVIGVMAGMVAIVYLYNIGSMELDTMIIDSSILSGVMFIIIILYAVYSFKVRDSLRMYKKMRDEQDGKKED